MHPLTRPDTTDPVTLTIAILLGVLLGTLCAIPILTYALVQAPYLATTPAPTPTRRP